MGPAARLLRVGHQAGRHFCCSSWRGAVTRQHCPVGPGTVLPVRCQQDGVCSLLPYYHSRYFLPCVLNTFTAIILCHSVLLRHLPSRVRVSIVNAPFYRSQTQSKVMAGTGSSGQHSSRITCLPSVCITQKILLQKK